MGKLGVFYFWVEILLNWALIIFLCFYNYIYFYEIILGRIRNVLGR